jgi:hypothetical protein
VKTQDSRFQLLVIEIFAVKIIVSYLRKGKIVLHLIEAIYVRLAKHLDNY